MSLYLPQSPPLLIVSHAPQFNFWHCLPGPCRHLSLQLLLQVSAAIPGRQPLLRQVSLFILDWLPWPWSRAGSSQTPSALIPSPCTKTRELFTWSCNILATWVFLFPAFSVPHFSWYLPALFKVKIGVLSDRELSTLSKWNGEEGFTLCSSVRSGNSTQNLNSPETLPRSCVFLGLSPHRATRTQGLGWSRWGQQL